MRSRRARATAATAPADLPAEYPGDDRRRSRVRRTLPQLRQFVEEGGTLIAIGGSTSIGAALRPGRHRARWSESRSDGTTRPLTAREVLRARIGPARARGQHDAARLRLRAEVDVFFDNSPVFRLGADADAHAASRGSRARRRCAAGGRGASVISKAAWRRSTRTLGRGRVLLFGPEITFRAQPHGTFKFLFNGIYYGKAVPAPRMPVA